MKTYMYTLIFMSILGMSALSYAKTENTNTSIKEIRKETQDLLRAIGSYTINKKDEAIVKAKDALNRLDKRINALEDKIDKDWGKMNKRAQKNARKSLRLLRKQRNQVSQWYGSMKSSSVNAWEQMKKGFSNAYKDLDDAFEKSKKEFRLK